MYKLVGTHEYAAGANGTVTLPEGAVLLQIIALGGSGGTVTIFGGDSIPLPANTVFPMRFLHRLLTAPKPTNNTIVFSGTTSYFVEYIKSGNT